MRVGLKLFYLRTRERGKSQQAVADAIGIRQATLSHLEQGISAPNSSLLLELSKYYDVTPTFLLDESRGLTPRSTDRWSVRDALVTVGMFVECAPSALIKTADGKVLCPLNPTEAFYDEEAALIRVRDTKKLASLKRARTLTERQLVKSLEGELQAPPGRRRRT